MLPRLIILSPSQASLWAWAGSSARMSMRWTSPSCRRSRASRTSTRSVSTADQREDISICIHLFLSLTTHTKELCGKLTSPGISCSSQPKTLSTRMLSLETRTSGSSNRPRVETRRCVVVARSLSSHWRGIWLCDLWTEQVRRCVNGQAKVSVDHEFEWTYEKSTRVESTNSFDHVVTQGAHVNVK